MSGATVRAILRGPVQPLGRTTSAIRKQPVEGAVAVGSLGLAGDMQADLRVHGGPDKAVHCYAWTHYVTWRDALPGCGRFAAPGAFGENLCVDGLDERSVCLGDVWRVGTAVLAVTQGRQPCFKLNLHFGVPDMAARVQDSLRAGWYLRVVESGALAAGDGIELLERPHAGHSIASLLALIRDRSTDTSDLAAVLALPLPASWRRLFERRLQSGDVEDWTRRMSGGD